MMSKQAEPAGSSDSALGGSPALERVIQVGKLMRQGRAPQGQPTHSLFRRSKEGPFWKLQKDARHKAE